MSCFLGFEVYTRRKPEPASLELSQKTESCQNVKGRKPNDDMPTHKLTTEIITAAILGFEAQKHKLDTQIAELRALLSPADSCLLYTSRCV